MKAKTNNPFKQLRIDSGMTQGQLKEKVEKYCPVSQARLSDIENGKNKKSVDLDLLKAYVEIFHVSADYLLGFVEDKETATISPDDAVCAEYLGLSRDAVGYIRHLSNCTDNSVYEETMTVSHSDVVKSTKYVKQHYKTLLFMLDCLLAKNDDTFDLGFENILEHIFEMISEFYEDNYISKDASIPYGRYDRSYRTAFIDIEDSLTDFIEALDYERLKSFVKGYDTRNESNIYADLFGADSE